LKKILLLLACLLFAAYLPAAVDTYIVGIGNDNETDGGGGLPIFLMKIDQNGNVVKAPVAAIPDTQLPPGNGNDERTVALAWKANGQLLVWVGQDEVNDVWRFSVDPNTFQAGARKRILTQIVDNDHLQATQPGPRFLASDKPEGKYKGLPVNASGNAPGSSFRLIPRYEDNEYHDSSIAADGMMAVRIMGNDDDQVIAQPLRADGIPTGLPKVAAHFDSFDVDVSNVLPNGRRFIVFTDRNGTCGRFLQVIDGATGARLGSPIELTSEPCGESNQSMAIDPLGRFVIFNVSGDEAGCSGSGNDPLFYLAISQDTGHPSGTLKQITPCDLYDNFHGTTSTGQFGIDILLVQ
jgi:hypothetical protein